MLQAHRHRHEDSFSSSNMSMLLVAYWKDDANVLLSVVQVGW
jgi:hypothetical protein